MAGMESPYRVKAPADDCPPRASALCLQRAGGKGRGSHHAAKRGCLIRFRISRPDPLTGRIEKMLLFAPKFRAISNSCCGQKPNSAKVRNRLNLQARRRADRAGRETVPKRVSIAGRKRMRGIEVRR